MSDAKNQEIYDLGTYIKTVKDQEVKVLLLKLKNELNKEDTTWEQIRDILSSLKTKNGKVLADIVPLIV